MLLLLLLMLLMLLLLLLLMLLLMLLMLLLLLLERKLSLNVPTSFVRITLILMNCLENRTMKIKRKVRKLWKSFKDCFDPKVIKDAGVYTGYASERVEAGKPTLTLENALTELEGSLNTTQRAIDIAQKGQDVIVGFVAENRKIRLKLEAAADIFRQIDCMTHDASDERLVEINKLVIEARRAATN
jgi:hypothetical protein